MTLPINFKSAFHFIATLIGACLITSMSTADSAPTVEAPYHYSASSASGYGSSKSAEGQSSMTSGDWDIDNNGRADALTDGLMFLRYAFGLRGDSLINGLISSDSVYTTAADIEAELSTVYVSSGDIDGNGRIDALTDGLLLLRYLFGLSGNTLTTGVVGVGATRT